jgi:hypothetical protein
MDIAAHRSNPEISLERHVKSRVVELGRRLENRAAIYLDTKSAKQLRHGQKQ